MLFKRKGRIRKTEDERLVYHLEELKGIFMNRSELVSKSVDPSEDVLYKLRLDEAKYLFLLKEARIRNRGIGKS